MSGEYNDSPFRDSQSQIKNARQKPVPNIPSNNIFIATSSIDGNVCVCSLVNPDDVVLRKFGRPVQAIAVSPSYKSDRSYISGGKAGNLVLTVGGQAGKTATSSTASNAPLATGWLGAMGITGINGVDTVLHSGEGSISTIKWSLSGKFVVWVNEYGIKILRSNLHLGSEDLDWAWKRVSHIDRPTGSEWDKMAGAWIAHAEWVDEDGLESERGELSPSASVAKNGVDSDNQSIRSSTSNQVRQIEMKKEKLVVGWGGSVWIINISDGARGTGRDRRIGRVEIPTMFVYNALRESETNFARLRTDCIVSGVSLYTPDLLVVLSYVTSDEEQPSNAKSSGGTPKRGITRRQNALQPELRIIDLRTREEVSADTLNVSRFESLTAADYHIGVLPALRASTKTTTSKGTLEVLGNIGGSIWDASLYSSKLLGTAAIDATFYSAHLFSSGASVRSGHSSLEKVREAQSAKSSDPSTSATQSMQSSQELHAPLLTRGMKIFIQSPYDCVLATKRTRADHLAWLVEHQKYEEAWNELDAHPDAVNASPEASLERTPTASSPSTPRGQTSTTLYDFFDDTSSSAKNTKHLFSQSEKEKRRIGDKWIQQLVDARNWNAAGQVCGKVLNMASSWEHWIWVFAEAKRHSDIAPFIPTRPLRPPIPPTMYEIILGYYISHDRPKLAEMLDRWPPDLFDAGSIIEVMESRLRTGEITESTVENGIKGRDWRIMLDSIAKLYLANGQTRDALKCYIKLQDADAALSLIRTHHLTEVVKDDIPSLILLRISKQQQKERPLADLEELSAEPIRLLVSEAHRGVVGPEVVIKQLQPRNDLRAFLFFYFRALWIGDVSEEGLVGVRKLERDQVTRREAQEGKSLVNDFADTALPLFAEHDRPLLFEFLKNSQSYTLSLASSICEKRDYVPEFVYLLSKEGRTKKALFIIIEKLDDVSQAIAFAKEQDDPDLWDDLVNYSMNKPAFIRALLEEAGTAIDPITLVRKIPEGLEIEGLCDSLTRMIREVELQDSISDGAARVFRGEVATRMSTLRAGQKSGIRFDVISLERASHRPSLSQGQKKARRRAEPQAIKHGHCYGCGEVFVDEESLIFAHDFRGSGPHDFEAVLSFPCFHAFHLSCLLRYDTPAFSRPRKAKEDENDGERVEGTKQESVEEEHDMPELPAIEGYGSGLGAGMGSKVTYAELLKRRIGIGGCPLEVHKAGQGTGEW